MSFPTPEQSAVIDAVASGASNLVVEAYAGTGKTTTILEAIRAYLAERPRAACAYLVFNKRNAEEVAERMPRRSQAATSHSWGFRALKRAFPQARAEFASADGDSLASVVTSYLSRPERGIMLAALASAKNLLVAPSDTARLASLVYQASEGTVREPRASELAEMIGAAMTYRMRNPVFISGDDMVWLPVVLGLPIPQFDLVAVDEAQDLTAAQIELACAMVRDGGRMVWVGDERQAIYGWRNAAPDALRVEAERTNARRLALTVTHRCPRAVVDVARAFVDDFRAGDDAPEGAVSHVASHAPLAGDWVISRTNRDLISLGWSLVSSGHRVCLLGKDAVAASIRATVTRSALETHRPLSELSTWVKRAVVRAQKALSTAEDDAETASAEAELDKLETISALCALAPSDATVGEFVDFALSRFAKEPSAETVTLATTHKAKGLEADRVWVLASTFLKRDTREEENLFYVAVTRAKRELFLSTGTELASQVAA